MCGEIGDRIVVRLCDVCTLNMGQSPESSTYNENGDGVPFYQGNADFGVISPTPRVWCSSPTKIAESGDLLISVRAPIGALNFAAERCCIGRGLAALRVTGQGEQAYLYYALKANTETLNALGTGSTFKAINKKALSSVLIPWPSTDVQRSIVARLAALDEIISLRRSELDKLDQLVKSRFVEAA